MGIWKALRCCQLDGSPPEPEVIVEVSLAHPYNADSAGLDEGPDTQQANGVCILVFIHMIGKMFLNISATMISFKIIFGPSSSFYY